MKKILFSLLLFFNLLGCSSNIETNGKIQLPTYTFNIRACEQNYYLHRDFGIFNSSNEFIVFFEKNIFYNNDYSLDVYIELDNFIDVYGFDKYSIVYLIEYKDYTDTTNLFMEYKDKELNLYFDELDRGPTAPSGGEFSAQLEFYVIENKYINYSEKINYIFSYDFKVYSKYNFRGKFNIDEDSYIELYPEYDENILEYICYIKFNNAYIEELFDRELNITTEVNIEYYEELTYKLTFEIEDITCNAYLKYEVENDGKLIKKNLIF